MSPRAARTAPPSTCSAPRSSRAPRSTTPPPAPARTPASGSSCSTSSPSGRATWAEYTAAHINENVAFTLDGRVISAPTITSAINGQTTITGRVRPGDRHRAGQPAPVRRPAADLHPGHRAVHLHRARRGAAGGRADRRRHRHRAGVPLRALLLPAARPGDDRQPRALGSDRLRLPGAPGPPDRLHPEPGRHRRVHRGDRYHGRLVRRLLRAAQGRDPGGPHPALRGAARLGPCPAHDPLRGRGQLPRRRDPLPAGDRRREGLRVHPRHVDRARPRRRLPLHPPADGRPRAVQVLRQQPHLGARPGPAHPPSRRCRRRAAANSSAPAPPPRPAARTGAPHDRPRPPDGPAPGRRGDGARRHRGRRAAGRRRGPRRRGGIRRRGRPGRRGPAAGRRARDGCRRHGGLRRDGRRPARAPRLPVQPPLQRRGRAGRRRPQQADLQDHRGGRPAVHRLDGLPRLQLRHRLRRRQQLPAARHRRAAGRGPRGGRGCRRGGGQRADRGRQHRAAAHRAAGQRDRADRGGGDRRRRRCRAEPGQPRIGERRVGQRHHRPGAHRPRGLPGRGDRCSWRCGSSRRWPSARSPR